MTVMSCVVVAGVGLPRGLTPKSIRAEEYDGPWRKRIRVSSRAALVEATSPPPLAVRKDKNDGSVSSGSAKLQVFPTDDMRAEARAMARAVDASVYSPELLATNYGSRPIKVLRRALQILIAFGSFGLKLLLDQRNGVLDSNKRLRAAELRRIFTRLGPTFVKIGQGLSTRPDICPTEYLEELSELQVGPFV